MSISITAEKSPAGKPTVYTCQCKDWSVDGTLVNPDCPECNGSGEIRFERLEYEVNFSNDNARQYIGYINGGTFHYCGRVGGEQTKKSLSELEKYALLMRMSSMDTGRIDALIRIFRWAIKNDSEVSWG